MPSANPPCGYAAPPNGRPSPLSLRDISPHCGESPFARGGLDFVTDMPPLKREVAMPQALTEGLHSGRQIAAPTGYFIDLLN